MKHLIVLLWIVCLGAAMRGGFEAVRLIYIHYTCGATLADLRRLMIAAMLSMGLLVFMLALMAFFT